MFGRPHLDLPLGRKALVEASPLATKGQQRVLSCPLHSTPAHLQHREAQAHAEVPVAHIRILALVSAGVQVVGRAAVESQEDRQQNAHCRL